MQCVSSTPRGSCEQDITLEKVHKANGAEPELSLGLEPLRKSHTASVCLACGFFKT